MWLACATNSRLRPTDTLYWWSNDPATAQTRVLLNLSPPKFPRFLPFRLHTPSSPHPPSHTPSLFPLSSLPDSSSPPCSEIIDLCIQNHSDLPFGALPMSFAKEIDPGTRTMFNSNTFAPARCVFFFLNHGIETKNTRTMTRKLVIQVLQKSTGTYQQPKNPTGTEQRKEPGHAATKT